MCRDTAEDGLSLRLFNAIGAPALAAAATLAAAYFTGHLDLRKAETEQSGSINLEKLKYSNTLIDRALEADSLDARARSLLFYADVGLLDGLNISQVRAYAQREIDRIENGDLSAPSFLPEPATLANRVRIDAAFIDAFAPDAREDARAALLGIGGFILAGFGITDTPLRLAHFMAQVAHETSRFRIMAERASGDAYEGRTDLGNTEPGDGRRYKGRGFIQIVGRANYARITEQTGVDVLSNPDAASEPNIALLVAAAYWANREVNAAADADDLSRVTKLITGGLTGLEDRRAKLTEAKALLGL
ncbi:Predicted chitinase [Albimonas donghaensis]|uniref:Predicted chitinase n=1 Tax=Albimonas donghaensis TaxID=356660 RepID=A0A1H2S9B5_9RHOB|nr:glycoside hydrolase family 19 protein [Albimonas donghaensis]SDW27579.1 Predicted chitinase [Albimonas donghaensis]